MIINKYFDHIYCLNLDRRPDKWERVNNRFKDLGIIVERYSAVDGEDISSEILSYYKVINRYALGCLYSHYNIIKDASFNNYKRILILEDDVIFCNNFHDKFLEFIKIADNWKLLYLGGSQHYWKGINIKGKYYHPQKLDGTFAYGIDSSIYQDILETENINNRPIDNILWDIQMRYESESYSSYPPLIIADISDSDIRGSRNIGLHRRQCRWDRCKYNE